MTARRVFEIRGRHVLAAMLAFFGAIIAVNVAFAVIAVRSFPGEDVQRSYLQGVQYNQTLAERRAQTALGWRAAATLHERESGAVLEVTLHRRNAAPINAADVTAMLQRHASARYDRELVLTPVGDGRYEADLGNLHPGRWRLRARARDETGVLDFESELRWSASR